MSDSEKRKHPRVNTHVPLKYRKLRDGAGVPGESSISRNLSEGGVRYKTAEFVSMACRLILELNIPMFTKPVKAISKVAWIRKTASGDAYEVGNQFLEMSKKNRKLISEYVDSLESQTYAPETETTSEEKEETSGSE